MSIDRGRTGGHRKARQTGGAALADLRRRVTQLEESNRLLKKHLAEYRPATGMPPSSPEIDVSSLGALPTIRDERPSLQLVRFWMGTAVLVMFGACVAYRLWAAAIGNQVAEDAATWPIVLLAALVSECLAWWFPTGPLRVLDAVARMVRQLATRRPHR